LIKQLSPEICAGGAEMMTDQEIKMKGFEALTQALGILEAEKFVTLLLRDRFDYTWRQTMLPNGSIEEISAAAMERRNKENQVQERWHRLTRK